MAKKKLEKFSQEKFDSERQTIPGEPAIAPTAPAAPDYAEIALAKLRSIAMDSSVEIVARVLAVEVLHARGEIGLEAALIECLNRKATNGHEAQVKAAKVLLEIATKK